MRVLTVNPGSNSLQLHMVATDRTEPVVLDQRKFEHRPDDATARDELRALLKGHEPADAVAHRLVHGGPELHQPTRVGHRALAAVRAAEPLAPGHVPATLRMIEAVSQVAAELGAEPAQVLCPDTAFHAGLPEPAAQYALPAEWRARYGLRRYGFHGLSCGWALRQAASQLDRPAERLRLVIAHLGGGCSATAVDRGRSLDTSMGFTPLEGMAMSQRSGSVDPGMLLWLIEHAGLTPAEVREGISTRSGLLGLSGRSGDTRDLVPAAQNGDREAALALAVFAHRARREIAAVAASLPSVDALVFTGEIGFDQPEVRDQITDGLTLLGPNCQVLVVEPREELELARLTAELLTDERGTSDQHGEFQ
jgi:acetate kinase